MPPSRPPRLCARPTRANARRPFHLRPVPILPPVSQVATARGKAVEIARAVRAQRRAAGAPPPLGGVLVIGADTVVQAAGGEILEKPDDDAHARAMLLTLAGREHEVHTGVALVVAEPAAGWKGGRWSDGGDGEDGGDGGGGSDDAIPHEATFVETTRVCFADVPPTEVDAYVSGGEPFGKAGAYGIQGAAALWVARVDGCYNNVVGLPLHALARAVAGLLDDGVIGEG